MQTTASSSAFDAWAHRLERWLPIARWLRVYTRQDFSGDLVAGIITAILLVPQGMAFGLLAGLPPQVGIYASILPPMVYALFGTSRTLAVGPVSVAAIMVAHALSGLPPGSDRISAALLIALLAGVFLIAMGIARLGVVANFLSHPVLSGFTSAAAIMIVLSQVPSLTGARVFRLDEFLADPMGGIAALLTIDPQTIAIGLGGIALLLFAAQPLPRLLVRLGFSRVAAVLVSRTAPLIVVVGSALLVSTIGGSITRIGEIPHGLPGLAIDIPSAESAGSLAVSALLISLVAYVESLSIAKVLAYRRRQRIDANQELIALGASNFSAAFSGGMPVAGGFSRTMVNYSAGARTQISSIITALLVAIVLVSFASFLEYVPNAALAAIIIVAVVKLIDVRGAIAIWSYDRIDGAVLAATLAGVLLLGIERGLALGIAVSLISFALRAARPHIAVLGRIRGSEHFRNVLRHKVETWPHVVFLRMDENLIFANASFLESVIASALADRQEVKHVVLVMSSVNTIDSTALEMLESIAVSVREAGVTLHMSDVKGPVMDRLKHAGFEHWLDKGKVFLSAHRAAEELAD